MKKNIVIIFLAVVCIGLAGYVMLKPEQENKANVDVISGIVPADIMDSYSNNALQEHLYRYLDTDKDFLEYFEGLDNNEKLAISGVEERVSFKELQTRLVSMFGTDLNVEAKDYYPSGDVVPLYFYNNGVYEYNYDFPAHGAYTIAIYNHALKMVEVDGDILKLVYYGLYYEGDVGFTYFNEKGFECDSEMLYSYYYNDRSVFMDFTYVFENVEGKYILVDFTAK